MGLQIHMSGFKSFLRSLFENDSAFIRELMQNAMEAIHSAEQNCAMEEKGKIEIFYDPNEKRISFTDNGCGMTEKGLNANLCEAFKSGWGDNNTESLGVGQFGFGFFSSLLIAEKVEVITRSRENPDSKNYWSMCCLTGEMSQFSVEDDLLFGTTISLIVCDRYAHFFSAGYLAGKLKDYFLFLPFPVYLNDTRVNIPTRFQWERMLAEAGAINFITEDVKEAFGWRDDPDVVFPCPEGVLVSSSERWVAPAVKIYRQGVFLLETEIIPPPLNFIFCGIFNVDDLTARPDRKSYREDKSAHAFSRQLINYVLEAYEKLFAVGGEAFVGFHSKYLNKFVASVMQFDELEHLRGKVPLTQVKSNSLVTSRATVWENILKTVTGDRVLYTEDPTEDSRMIEYFSSQGEVVLYIKNDEDKELAKYCVKHARFRFVSVSECYISTLRREAVFAPELEKLFEGVTGDRDFSVACVEDDDMRFPTRVLSCRVEEFESLQSLSSKEVEDEEKVLFVSINHPAIKTLELGLKRGADSESLKCCAEALFYTAALIEGDDSQIGCHIILAASLQNLIEAALNGMTH